MTQRSEQLQLPLGVYPPQSVEWRVVKEVRDRKRLGRKAVVSQVGRLQYETVSVDDINELEDPNLRYALRFAAAARSMGSVADDEYSSHGQIVYIGATAEGTKSRLLRQKYSGTGADGVDTFLADIRSFDPGDNEDH